MTRTLRLLAAFCLTATSVQARADDTWTYRAWIAKAGRLLRAGEPLPAAQIEELAQKSPDEVVDTLMASPGFADTVLDFNLYFLGAKPAKLFTPDYRDPASGKRLYAMEVFEVPQAIAAAQAVVNGGDFFQVLDDIPQRYVTPFGKAEDGDQLGKFHAALDLAVAAFHPAGPETPADKAAGCAVVLGDHSPLSDASEALFKSGFFEGGQNFGLDLAAVSMPSIDASVACFVPDIPVARVLDGLAAWRVTIDKLYAQAADYSADSYAIRKLTDIRTLANAETDRYLRGTSFDLFGFWNTYQNSSTNYNRKRAAHILRTYFCDDLTPLNVVPGDTSPHTGDAHASDPSCQSCHYKLDPMAGFFKERGIIGYDFSGLDAHVFDDQAIFTGEKLAAYREAWPVTGYVRSTRDPAQNDYGRSLPDLLAIIRRAPEVKQCLTRRLAEYTLGRTQTIDGAWIDHLSQQFTVNHDSSGAFKGVLREMLLSKTFVKADAQTDQCYDNYPEGTVPELPCAVSFVIRNNCASCHRGTDQRHGGLDLTHWQPVGTDADGTPLKGFPHLDARGAQVPPAETFTRIQTRLNTADPVLAMPLMRDMPATEKARLFRWVNEQTTTGGAP